MKITFFLLLWLLLAPLKTLPTYAEKLGAPAVWFDDQGIENSIRFRLDTSFSPIQKWNIRKGVLGQDFELLGGSDERFLPDVYLLEFDTNSFSKVSGFDFPDKPVFLGWTFTYPYCPKDQKWTPFSTTGIARARVAWDKKSERVIVRGLAKNLAAAKERRSVSIIGDFAFLPHLATITPIEEDISEEEGWALVSQPTIASESGGSQFVCNSWDYAGMTVGAAQLAAHDSSDLKSMFTSLIGSKSLSDDEWDDAVRWFPELTARGLDLKYSRNGTEGNFEDKTEACILTGHGWNSMPETFIRFCNPNVLSEYPIDQEELHFIARWIMWSLSREMQTAQRGPLVDEFTRKLSLISKKVTERRLTGDLAAASLVVLHWSDGKSSTEAVIRILNSPNPLENFLSLREETTSFFPGLSEKGRQNLSQRFKTAADYLTGENASNLRKFLFTDGKLTKNEEN